MGGAQPLAAVMAGACCLAVECDETRADFRLRTRYCRCQDPYPGRGAGPDRPVDQARARRNRVALIGNAAEVFPELLRSMQAGERSTVAPIS